MKRRAILVVIGFIVIAFIFTGFVGQGKKANNPNVSLEKRISALEAEIAELKVQLQGSRNLQVAKEGGVTPVEGEATSSSGGTNPKPKPLIWTEGQRGWDENGTNIWTSNLAYNVGIGTNLPAYRLDVNGDIRITGGINDGASFGLANDVLVADGLGNVQWGAAPGGSNAYIWNQSAVMQGSNGEFWITLAGQAGDGVGVTGVINAGNAGVYGQSNDNTGAGVFGDGLTNTAGIYGQTNIDTFFGVWGYNANASGTGIAGSGNGATTTYLTGGSGVAGSGPNVGVFGYGDATLYSYGMYGVSDADTGIGVYGLSNGGVAGVGVLGYANNANGFGVRAHNNDLSGTGLNASGNGGTGYYFTGGSGTAGTSSNVGAVGFGTANGSYGVYGYSLADGIAVFGRTSVTTGTANVGIGNGGSNYVTLNVGSGGAFTGDTCGVAGFSFGSAGTRFGGYFDNFNGTNYAYVALDWGLGYKINGSGAVSTIMETRAGRKNLFAPESPEAWLEDIGEGQLKNGHSGKINLDPLFLDCIVVNAQHPLKVFVQLRDDCKGVYVKTYNDGFEVIELQNGTSNAKFSYRVIGSWKGYEDARFPEAPPRLTKRVAKTTDEKIMTSSAEKEINAQGSSKRIKNATHIRKKVINLQKESSKGTEPLKKNISK